MSEQKVLFEVRDLVKKFPLSKKRILTAVNHVTFDVYEGEKFGVVGESGCGKSTLGRVMLQLYSPTAGEVIFHGKAVDGFKAKRPAQHGEISAEAGLDLCKLSSKEIRSIRHDMQMIFQDPAASLDPRQTVGKAIDESLLLNSDLPADQRKQRVLELLERVGLKREHYDVYPHNLSGGQKQRVGIARAIAMYPSFIVLDEAVSALDVSVKAQILQLLNSLQDEQRMTYFFITHDLGVAKHFCDRIMVMYLGNICELAPSKELFNHCLHPYTQSLLDSVPRLRLEGDDALKSATLEGEVPSPIDPPSGCPFHTRCSKCMDVCSQQQPKLRQVRPGHYVACHLYDAQEGGNEG